MRLPILYKGLSPIQKIQTFFIHKMLRFVPGPILILSYRKRFFGKYFSQLIHQVLRKAEHWTLAEVELFGAFVSSCNSCKMCASDHQAVASQAMHPDLVKTILYNYQTAPIDARLRTTLGFLEKLSTQPHNLTFQDIQPMYDAGLNDAAIIEAAEVCMILSTMNRLVDAFGFKSGPNPDQAGVFLFKNGYKVATLAG